MKVHELLNKIIDSYITIAINEYRDLDHTGRRYVIEEPLSNFSSIPEDVLNADVERIVPYYDMISIEIEAKDNEENNNEKKTYRMKYIETVEHNFYTETTSLEEATKYFNNTNLDFSGGEVIDAETFIYEVVDDVEEE